MKESLFISNNQKPGRNLKIYLKTMLPERRNPKIMTSFIVFFSSTSRSVVIFLLPEPYGNTGTVEYLNNLVARAHQAIYVSRPKSLSGVFHFCLGAFHP